MPVKWTTLRNFLLNCAAVGQQRFPERHLRSSIGLETLVVVGLTVEGLCSRAKLSAWRLSLQCANLSCLTVASTRGGACGLIRCDAFQSYDSCLRWCTAVVPCKW